MQTRKYPRAGVHLKHAAIPHRTTCTVSGIPPVAVRTSKPAVINYIRVYGNTVKESGVGDATANLMKTKSATVKGLTVTTNSQKTQLTINGTVGSGSTNTALSNVLSLTAKTTYYVCIRYISGSATVSSSNFRFITTSNAWAADLYSSSNITNHTTVKKAVSKSADTDVVLGIAAVAGDVFDNYTIEIALYATNPESPIPDAEPSGYKIPVVLQSGQSTSTAVIYLDSPLSATSYYAEITDGLPELYKGLTTVSTNTLVLPSKIELSYSVR